MQTPPDIAVIPRDLHFRTESARGAAWLGGDPVATAVFNAQEALHSREHASLNAHLDRSHYPVERIEGSVRRRLAFLRRLGRTWMLGVTIALEHFTAMLADMFDSDLQLWTGTPEEILRLWRWHAMEETEHKAVAFDVFQEATREWSALRRYLFRVHIISLTSVHFTLDVIRFAGALLEAGSTGRWRARWQVVRFLFGEPGIFRKLGPRYRDWYRPGFHPWITTIARSSTSGGSSSAEQHTATAAR
jgi:hypothetical protein